MRLGKHRGFAFVEYVTKQEARNALEALSNTHLYGRHLVRYASSALDQKSSTVILRMIDFWAFVV